GDARGRRPPPDAGRRDALGLRPGQARRRPPERPAQEGRARQAVAPRLLHGRRDPDARAGDDLELAGAGSHVERRPVERQPVVLARQRERLAEPARPGAEEPARLEAAALLHRLDAGERLERPDQNRVRDALRLADEVETPVDAVGAVDVRVAGRAEHRRVALRPAAVAVSRRILVVVGLDLDDHAADPVDVELRADELRRDLVDTALEVQSAFRSKRTWSRHSPAISRNRFASPNRSKPFFSSTRCEATLSTSVPASSRGSSSSPKAESTTSASAAVA